LKLEKNKSLLEKFREKDASAHRKSRQLTRKDPIKMAKTREQNRERQAKRRRTLASEKLGSQFNQICSLSTPAASEAPYKSIQSFSKAVHRSERALPHSPTKKKEIV